LEIETSKNAIQTNYMTPKLYMVDLAGSERASATSDSKLVRQKEGSNINKSLLSLGNCINILS
jgi:kinesin family protein 18/19